jgi:hypothetical protein
MSLEGPEVVNQDPPVKGIATAFTLQLPLSNGGHCVIQSYIDRDASGYEYSMLLDKMYGVYERQDWKGQVERLEATVEQDEKRLTDYIRDFDAIGEKYAAAWHARGKKGDPAVGPKEDAERRNAQTNIQQAKDVIEKNKKQIKLLKDRISKGFEKDA